MIDILGEKHYHYILTGLGQVGFLNDFELPSDSIYWIIWFFFLDNLAIFLQ